MTEFQFSLFVEKSFHLFQCISRAPAPYHRIIPTHIWHNPILLFVSRECHQVYYVLLGAKNIIWGWKWKITLTELLAAGGRGAGPGGGGRGGRQQASVRHLGQHRQRGEQDGDHRAHDQDTGG